MADAIKILCTICARGGSKGVKHKNIRPLLGKPLIAYTIEQALRWNKAKDIVVSTDSWRIAEIAKKYGALVPFMRPKALAADKAPKFPSVRHAWRESERIFRERYDIIVDLDPSAPLRKINDLDNCLKVFLEKRPQTLFSVVKARRNPYFNMVELKPDGFARLSKKYTGTVASRQQAPAVYSMNASIYFYSRDFLLDQRHKMPFSQRSAIYIMDEISRYDIDNELDFKFVEFLLKQGVYKNNG